MTVRLSSKLPPLEGNGLAPIEEGLSMNPKERRVAIVSFDVDARFDMHADGVLEPRARIIQIEVMQGDAADEARELMLQEYRQRTGATQLFEPEDLYGDGGAE